MEPSKAALKKRPAYRPMWEQAERELKGVKSQVQDLGADRQGLIQAMAALESDYLTQGNKLNRWATVATIELLALVIVAIVLLAR